MDRPLSEIQKELVDKIIVCVDCGNNFVYTTGEQIYYISKGLTEPKRCEACRKQRKDTLIRPNKSRAFGK